VVVELAQYCGAQRKMEKGSRTLAFKNPISSDGDYRRGGLVVLPNPLKRLRTERGNNLARKTTLDNP